MSADLETTAKTVRRKLVAMHYGARANHVGSGLSCVEILTYLYGAWLRPQDRFILSKGHAASALYATLWAKGLFSDSQLQTYYREGTTLPAHPAPRVHPAIPAATGSLGHGLPIAAGMAYANRHLAGGDGRVACLLSDGECNEGSVWEAALFAGHHRLANLVVLIDANGLQGFGRTEDVLNLEPLASKWRAFGFTVDEIDGHDLKQLGTALAHAGSTDAPHSVICRTVKGKGVSFMEDRLEWHYLSMSAEQYDQAAAELA
jgi:transketolase